MSQRLKLLVASHAALCIVSMAVAASLPPGVYFEPIKQGYVNLILAQATLVGFAVGMAGAQPLRGLLIMLAAAGFLAAAMLLWLVLAVQSPWYPSVAVAVIAALRAVFNQFLRIALVTGVFWAMRQLGTRLRVIPSDESRMALRPHQFTLRQVLLTSVAAILAAYYSSSRNWRWHEDGSQSISTASLMVAALAHLLLYACVANAAAWATLRPARPSRRVALLLIATVPLGIAMSVAHGGEGPSGILLMLEATLAWALVPAAVWIGSFLVVRLCGYRLVTVDEERLAVKTE